jgi:hypothetical protein
MDARIGLSRSSLLAFGRLWRRFETAAGRDVRGFLGASKNDTIAAGWSPRTISASPDHRRPGSLSGRV